MGFPGQTIEHEGTIQGISGDVVRVEIISRSACADCHAKGVCSLPEQASRVIEVEGSTERFRVGEPVKVVMEYRMGLKAVFWAYILPFLIVLATLFLSSAVTPREDIMGLSALGMLSVYYILLRLFRDRLKKTLIFKIKKLASA